MTGMSLYNMFDTAFRAVTLLVALLMVAFVMMAGSRMAFAASLRSDVILDSDILTVGDIFENAGKNAEYVLGPAPQPGQEMVLNASTLLRVAMALDMPWRPQHAAEQIVVKRSASIVPEAEVKAGLESALRDQGAGDNFTLDTGSQKLEIVLPAENTATFEVTDVKYNARTGHFEAKVSAPSAQNPVKLVSVSGNLKSKTTIPVLKNTLRNGDLITDADLDYIDIVTAELQPDTILKAEDMIGMTPRRMAASGKPVRALDLQAPLLVARGEPVTIVFETGPLKLTASGKAIQHGAKGDLIRVVNAGSNRTIDATVTGHREVTVQQ